MKCRVQTRDLIGPFYKTVLGKNKIDSKDNIQNELWKYGNYGLEANQYF